MQLQYSAHMAALQIRDVPEPVRTLLAEEAKRRGTSLQSYLLEVLEREAANASNSQWLERHRSDPNRPRTGVSAEDIVAAIREVRDGRAR